MAYCLVCGKRACAGSYGYTFCDEHKKYGEIDPEALEELVIWRLEGKSVSQIEGLLNTLLESV